MLNREQILGAEDLRRIEVAVPEWGDGATVWIQTMTSAARDALQSSFVNGKEVAMTNWRARLVVCCLVDANGRRLFDDADADAFGAKNAEVILRLFEAAQKLNGASVESVEDARKNS